MIGAAILVTCVVAGYKISKNKKSRNSFKSKNKIKALPPAKPMITLENIT